MFRLGRRAMPIHDWTRVDAGLFHAFHQSWIIHLCDALNAGGLQPEYFALPEQSIRGPIPDVLTLRLSGEGDTSRAAYLAWPWPLLRPERVMFGALKRRSTLASRIASLFDTGTVKS